jgi:ribosomal protein S18 acetylase RimI-like enzyme
MGQPPGGLETPAGTIQGLRLDGKLGAIQNVGVVPAFRGRGIGQSLLRLALRGFRDSGCTEVQLEVTVHNLGAIRLYESMGFRYTNTVFKVGNIPVTG